MIAQFGRMWLACVSTIIFTFASSALAEDVTCECLEATCKPCEVELGVSFYSAKCGPENTKVKSCKKVSCKAVDNQKQCLANLPGAKAEPQGIVAKAAAPATPSDDLGPHVGKVIVAAGDSTITHRNGVATKPRPGDKVFEADVLETGDTGKIKVVFLDSNELNVISKSKVKIDTMKYEPAAGQKRTILDLVYGKIRSKVKQKYDGAKNEEFKVKTKTAVAGIRGTDFVAEFDPNDKEWVTKVQTLSGSVELADAKEKKKVSVPAGTYAAFIIKDPPKGAFNEVDLEKIMAKGVLTAAVDMTPEQLRAIDASSDFDDSGESFKRIPASTKDSAASEVDCASPKGKYNQCSWTCEGTNPAGEKRCRTDQQGVRCVRRICKANGQWSDMERMPASQGDFCEPVGFPVIKDCGSYF